MGTEQVFHMNGGEGDTSYANNSSHQRNGVLKGKPILEEIIRKVYCTINPKCLKVADLGCASGPNALMMVNDIINIVESTSFNFNRKPPSFQFYMNDLPSNDFNTIFKSLAQFYETLEEKKGPRFGPCFINATPGTFYKRLFPDNSIHFFHSTYSVHWLSQPPEELTNGAEAYNMDNIYLTSTNPPETYKAYLRQFQHDFKLFLKSRSEELVPGGAIFLTFVGRKNTPEIRTVFGLLGMSLNDMVLENLIEGAKLEFFNMPLYSPTAEEAKAVIEEEGSFTIQRLESMMLGWDANINEDELDENSRCEFIAKTFRAITETLLKARFGEDIMDELYLRLKNKLIQMLMKGEKLESPNLVISLVKKSYKDANGNGATQVL
ncbi:PREDICTED: 7-methylxanthosine synthase 1-like isoform X2 [Lupinus angustifolius]|uniref:7-methylxanthosine synthase 1-like isoform X2 n=1 Tax=Lupinus angustifolius TaxID=3871 RepID=UPI00092E529B|nr:PREDICTED: 7-methylxanthosine synthase 1-like isoform X2 [Lupinus angustifolius]